MDNHGEFKTFDIEGSVIKKCWKYYAFYKNVLKMYKYILYLYL